MAEVQKSPFVKQLAANDRPTRDKAVDSLRTYLSGKRTFTETDLLKLWKGLYFCMWMSDRPRTQQQLAADLASLVESCHKSNRVAFLQAFWETMAREWTNIDVLRMDKFLLLVRRFLAATFVILRKNGWKSEEVEKDMAVISEVPLNARNSKISNGLRYHVLDIYVDELEKADDREGDELIPLEKLMRPVELLKANSPVKTVRQRAADTLEDERLKNWNKSEAEDPVEGNDTNELSEG